TLLPLGLAVLFAVAEFIAERLVWLGGGQSPLDILRRIGPVQGLPPPPPHPLRLVADPSPPGPLRRPVATLSSAPPAARRARPPDGRPDAHTRALAARPRRVRRRGRRTRRDRTAPTRACGDPDRPARPARGCDRPRRALDRPAAAARSGWIRGAPRTRERPPASRAPPATRRGAGLAFQNRRGHRRRTPPARTWPA